MIAPRIVSSLALLAALATSASAQTSPTVTFTLDPTTPIGPAATALSNRLVILTFNDLTAQVGDTMTITSGPDAVIADLISDYLALDGCTHTPGWTSTCALTFTSVPTGAGNALEVFVRFSVRNGGLTNGATSVPFSAHIGRGTPAVTLVSGSANLTATLEPSLTAHAQNDSRSFKGAYSINGTLMAGTFYEGHFYARELGSGRIGAGQLQATLTIPAGAYFIGASGDPDWSALQGAPAAGVAGPASITSTWGPVVGRLGDLTSTAHPPAAPAMNNHETDQLRTLVFVPCGTSSTTVTADFSTPGLSASATYPTSGSMVSACDTTLSKSQSSSNTIPGGSLVWPISARGEVSVANGVFQYPEDVVIVDRIPSGLTLTDFDVNGQVGQSNPMLSGTNPWVRWTCTLPSPAIFGYAEFVGHQANGDCVQYLGADLLPAPAGLYNFAVIHRDEWRDTFQTPGGTIEGVGAVQMLLTTDVPLVPATTYVNFSCEQQDTLVATTPWVTPPATCTDVPEDCACATATISAVARPQVDVASRFLTYAESGQSTGVFGARFKRGSNSVALQFADGQVAVRITLPDGFLVDSAAFNAASCPGGSFVASSGPPLLPNVVEFIAVGAQSLAGCGNGNWAPSAFSWAPNPSMAFLVNGSMDPTYPFTNGADEVRADLFTANPVYASQNAQNIYRGWPDDSTPAQYYGQAMYDLFAVQIDAPASLSLLPIIVGESCVDGQLAATFTVENGGGQQADNVDLQITTALTALGPPTSPTCTWPLTTLAAHQSCSFTVPYLVSSAGCESITATITAVTPTGSTLSPSPRSVEVCAADCPGVVRVIKRFGDSAGPLMGGVEFTLATSPPRTATTDANGVATFADVPVGSYSVSEVMASLPAGTWVAPASQTVVVGLGTTSELTFVNTCTCPICNTCQIDGSCVPSGVGQACGNTDSNLCTNETCNDAGACVTSSAVDCDGSDLVDFCTDARCNPSTGACEAFALTLGGQTPEDRPVPCGDNPSGPGAVFAFQVLDASQQPAFILCTVLPPNHAPNPTSDYLMTCGNPMSAAQLDAALYDGFVGECVSP